MHRDPTLFPNRDDESDDAAQPSARGEGDEPRRLQGHIRAGDLGQAHTARSRRQVEATGGYKLRDVDTAEQAHRFRALVWTGAGGIMGAFVGGFVANGLGFPILIGILVGLAGGWALLYASVVGFSEGAGTFAGVMAGGGRAGAIKAVRQYSLPESLAMRGDYAGARQEYERLAALYPDDSELPARLARLWRDEENRPEEAAAWFRRALAVPGLGEGQALLLLRELVEVQVHRLDAPRRAFPDLARVARTREGTPAGAWAAAELRRLKEAYPLSADGP